MEESDIQEFYKSCNIFITGGTGFMGKILIEKLLRSTNVSTLYVLIREKKGKNIHTRIDELFDDVVFDRLKKECPKFKCRVEAVPGDCSVSGLGLNITDRQTLITNINIVFHVAATVRFDENLKLAYTINVSGSKDVLALARQMKSLKSLIHVSTAYSNCPYSEIDEKIYDSPISYESVETIIEKMSRNEAESFTTRIIGKWPNTYTFTKALAESMIKDVGGGLPVGIFRPSIVISTYREPMEGWIDNLYGPTGICAAALSGILRVMPCGKNKIADVVPVDTCVAGLIVSAWDVATRDGDRTAENIPVYNYVSSTENPITWHEFIQLNLIHGIKYPVINSVWATFVIFTSNFTLLWFLKLVYHMLPALVIDLAALISGNKPRMLEMYKKIHKLENILSYFSVRTFRFSNKNTLNLWKRLNRTDQELFPLSILTVHWLIYFRRYIQGIRLYLLKDPESNLEAARNRDAWLNYFNEGLKIIIIFMGCNAVSALMSRLYTIIF